MGPAVVHNDPVIGGDGGWGHRLDRIARQYRQLVGHGGGGIGTVKADLDSSELAELLLIFGSEVETELMEHFVGSRVGIPQVTCHGEDTGQFKQKKSEDNQSHIEDSIAANCCNVLDLTEALPDHFNGIRWGPKGCNAGSMVSCSAQVMFL